MKKPVFLILFSAIVLLVSVYLLGNPKTKYELPFYQYNTNTQRIEKFLAPKKEFNRIRHFEAKDQEGKLFVSSQLNGKIYIVDYFFVTCPGICKKMGVQMQRLYQTFLNDENIVLVSFTSMPEEDTIQVLSRYSREMGVNDPLKWKFLWADRAEIYDLAKFQFSLLNENEGEGDFVHTERFALIDKKGYIRGYYDGTSPKEVDVLIGDIQKLKKEK